MFGKCKTVRFTGDLEELNQSQRGYITKLLDWLEANAGINTIYCKNESLRHLGGDEWVVTMFEVQNGKIVFEGLKAVTYEVRFTATSPLPVPIRR